MSETNVFGRIASAYQALVNYFIPDAMKNDRTADNQARMFLISHTMGPILGNSVPLSLYFFDPTPGWDILVLAASITGFWIFPFLLRRGFSYDALVIASVINLNFCIYWSCYTNGGVASPTLPWLLIIPILSLFYIGGEKRLQTHLLAVSGVSFLVFITAYFYFDPMPSDVPVVAIQGLGIVSTTAALAYVATMAIYYSKIFDAGVELEKEVRRRREATEALREAVAEADRSGAMKTEFLAKMSHELRTPLNAVIGYSEIIREDIEDLGHEAMEKDVNRIHDAGVYLLRLINMILDLAKLESGKLAFDFKEHNSAEIVSSVLSGHVAEAEAKGTTISFSVETDDASVVIDAPRFSQVLDAIVSNAVQYTNDGRIDVVLSDGPSADRFRVTINDTGRGIAPEQLATLFSTFVATQEASDTRYGGTGLNLTVTHMLCTAMGGSIKVDSEVGKGSRFVVEMQKDGRNVSPRPVLTALSAEAAPELAAA